MKKIKEKRILIVIITFLISSISYISFVKGYFSVDAVKILKLGYMGYGTQYSLFDGRIFMFLICWIANLVNIGIRNLYIILLICSIFISSISVLKIYEIIIELKKPKNRWINILIFLTAYCYIFHFMYIDNLQFAECFIMAMSILLHIISAQKIILQNKNWQGFIFCFLAILFYQGTVNIFITTIFLFMIIQKNQSSKEKIRKLLTSGGIVVGAVAIEFIIVHIIQNHLSSIQGNRLTLEIIKNLTTLISNLPKLIFNSLELFPNYLHYTAILLLFFIIYVHCVKNKKMLNFYLAILLIFVCYGSTLLLGLLYESIISVINGRVFTSVGSSVSVLIIFVYLNTDIFEERINEKIFSVLIVFWFLANIINTVYITTLFKQGNDIDEQFSNQIQSEIKKYENETKNKVSKIAINFIIIGDEKMNIMVNSMRTRALYNHSVYELYTNQEIEKVFFDEEELKEYFNDKEEKIMCMGDTIYVQARCY